MNDLTARAWRVALTIVVSLGIALCGGCGGPEEPKSEDQQIADKLKPGDIVTLTNARLGVGYRRVPVVEVFATRTALDEALKFAAAKDSAGLRMQAERGDTFKVAAGTKARILDPDPAGLAAEVRIQDGEHTDKSGWIGVAQIQP